VENISAPEVFMLLAVLILLIRNLRKDRSDGRDFLGGNPQYNQGSDIKGRGTDKDRQDPLQ